MRRLRRIFILIIIDIILVNIALYASLWLRFDGHIPVRYVMAYQQLVIVFTVLMLLFFLVFGLYNRLWQYASVGEMVSIVGAVSVAMAVFFGYTFIPTQTLMLPRSVFVYTWLSTIFLIGASRLSWRFMRDHWFFPEKARKLKPVLVVGAGDAGATVARELKNYHNSHKSVPIGFVDDDRSKQKLRMFGIPILGEREDIPRLVQEYDVEEIIIAIPSAPGEVIREIVDICSTTAAKLKILPGIYELIDGKVSVNQIRELQVEDLLDREPVRVNLEAMSGYLEKRVVLVTGAGGSIGSELCRQVMRFAPQKLLLLDHSENCVYEIHGELVGNSSGVEVIPVVGDVKDSTVLADLFQAHRPQVVFHAAAYKHVPLMEYNQAEALRNNVLGTLRTAHAAHQHGTETYIFISTDKAVNPTSVMGASKRVAEMAIQQYAQKSATRFAAVRFGNVLDSRGSVVPLFKKQIARGGPVTVTHPEMTRYFMTIPEAVQLVIQAGSMTEGGEVFVLDMGKPMKILELAGRMIRLAGFRPGKDIEIIFTGIRPGEKLFEETLTAGEGIHATCHQRIFRARPDQPDAASLGKLLDAVERPGWRPADTEVAALLRAIIPDFGMENNIFSHDVGIAAASSITPHGKSTSGDIFR